MEEVELDDESKYQDTLRGRWCGCTRLYLISGRSGTETCKDGERLGEASKKQIAM